VKIWIAFAIASSALTFGLSPFGSAIANAAPIMHVHDSSGNLATVDVVTGAVNVIGNMGVTMTDIAFDPNGNLFGVSFTSLYSINAQTAAASFIGNLGRSSGHNSLVFSSTGTLYAASGTSTDLFTINTATGAAASLGNMGFASGGDLAFFNDEFYLASVASELVKIDLGNLANTSAVGPFGVANVFGLATGDNNILYGVGGTLICEVNTASGAASACVDYGGQGLGQAFGQSFSTEAVVPEPGTALLLGVGMAVLSMRARRPTRRCS